MVKKPPNNYKKRRRLCSCACFGGVCLSCFDFLLHVIDSHVSASANDCSGRSACGSRRVQCASALFHACRDRCWTLQWAFGQYLFWKRCLDRLVFVSNCTAVATVALKLRGFESQVKYTVMVHVRSCLGKLQHARVASSASTIKQLPRVKLRIMFWAATADVVEPAAVNVTICGGAHRPRRDKKAPSVARNVKR